MRRSAFLLLLPLLAMPVLAAPEAPARPAAGDGYRVPAAMPDALQPLSPADVRLEGYLGTRVANSERNRLLNVDEEELLAGFRLRPGKQAWIGEHVGKWLHAASLAWENTRDPALRTKLDRVVTELIKTQEPDGYLGTYVPDKRFGLYPGADWDVWVHKYDLIGLLAYYRVTRAPAAMDAAREVGDLLVNTFGPSKKSILSAGTHVGMAATSVLEPMVLLYRTTGEPRYLEFARYLVSAWDEPKGPGILKTLITEKSVAKTGNGKAYEMLSNLVGLCELARATGDRHYLEPALNAWQDVTANQLYLTGTASYGERFRAPHDLPNQQIAKVGETCVTVTWIQLNQQLLRLTGEAKYGDELERSYYNHLMAAQRPDGAQWCYYTALEGRKPYGPGTNCCVSSGPRGMALAPQAVYLRRAGSGSESLAVDLFEDSEASLTLDGKRVTIQQRTRFPKEGRSTLAFSLGEGARFGLQVRAPEWAAPVQVQIPGGQTFSAGADGWVSIPARRWKNAEQVSVSFTLGPRQIEGQFGNAGRTALAWGPLVLAYDEKRNPDLPTYRLLSLAEPTGTAPFTRRPGLDGLEFTARVRSREDPAPKPAVFVPFSEAGADSGRYQVWMRGPGLRPAANESVFAFARESRSRKGNVDGELTDGDTHSFVVTFDGAPQEEAWFAVEAEKPVTFQRVIYAHGLTFHDGGWFDASAGKPRVEVRRTAGGSWEPLGVLADYPATTATDAAGIRPGQPFTLSLPAPVAAVGIRVIGRPASGDNPKQAFASCAELQAIGSRQ